MFQNLLAIKHHLLLANKHLRLRDSRLSLVRPIERRFRPLDAKKKKNSVLFSQTRKKILGKLKGHAPGEINLQSKQDLICHVFATSAHFQRTYYFHRIKASIKPKENIFYTQ